VEEISALTNRLSTAYQDINSLGQQITLMNKELIEDKEQIRKAQAVFKEAYEQDYDYLRSLLPPGGSEFSLSSLVSQYLERRFGSYYQYAMKGMQAVRLLKAEKEEKKETRPKRRKGQNIPFPSRVYPKYLLENLGISMGSKEESDYLEGYLKNLSSDPDLTDQPTTFGLTQKQGEQLLGINGTIDTRSSSTENLSLEFKAAEYPLIIEEGLIFLNIERIVGKYSFRGSFTLDNNNTINGDALLSLKELVIISGNKEGAMNRILIETITSPPSVDFKISYRMSSSTDIWLNVSSNIDKTFSESAGELLKETGAAYEQQIRNELTKRLEKELEKNAELNTAIQDIEKTSDGNLKEIRSYRGALEQKQEELELKLASLQKEAADQLKSKATEELKKLGDKLQLPKSKF
jgi:uncharacterized protein (TIGR03545 family)